MERQDNFYKFKQQRLQRMKVSRDLSFLRRQQYNHYSHETAIEAYPTKGYRVISDNIRMQKNRAISNLLQSILVAKLRTN